MKRTGRPPRKWTPEEDALIRQHWGKLSVRDIAKMLPVGAESVRTRGAALGLPPRDDAAERMARARAAKPPAKSPHRVAPLTIESDIRRRTIKLGEAIAQFHARHGLTTMPYRSAA